MRLSKYLFPTLKEVPSDAVVISHILMLRAGMIRKLSAGIYNYLPLALKTIKKIENIIREEMNEAGALELLMPAVQPSELWIETGRWGYYGPELLRFKDRKNGDYCLGPTHEEVITHIVRNEISSYKELPKNLYQIQTKFRDEIRPRFGLMRGREFIMKDAYSFDIDVENAKKSYEIMNKAYRRIFDRCGLKYKAVEAGTGAIGGTLSHEFQVLASNGEDEILSCSSCNYAANIEKTECTNPDIETDKKPDEGLPSPEKVETPLKTTIEEVSEYLKIGQDKLIKTLIYTCDKNPIAILLRGDHELAEAKLIALIKCDELVPADEKTILKVTGGPVGFSGPTTLKEDIPIYADYAVANVEDGVVGGNEKDLHIKHIWPGRDITKKIIYADLREALVGESCPRCKKGKYEKYRGIEVGQIFYLGKKYSEKMDAYVLDNNGKKRIIVMGCYGIGVTRTMAASIEQNHDENGIIWPFTIAPYHVIICPVGKDEAVKETAENIYNTLCDKDVEVLLDDRNERPGVMFKDADLIGIPIRVTVGKKGLDQGKIEVKLRREKETKLIHSDEVIDYIEDIITWETTL